MSRRRTTSFAALLAALVALASISAGTALAEKGENDPNLLKAESMVGVPSTMLLAAGTIRNIPGPGAPWTLTSAKVVLSTTGHLVIKVDGLVVATSGSNPSANFRAVVSCLDSTNAVVNIPIAQFPATTGPASAGGGDAKLETDVTLPHPCIAPIVFVMNAGGTSWFATTGG
jgi:hypothetical protein